MANLPRVYSRQQIHWRKLEAQVAIDSLGQVFCSLASASLMSGYAHMEYRVCAVHKDGSYHLLVDSVGRMEEALFIEATIERFLGIEDRPVNGEVPRE